MKLVLSGSLDDGLRRQVVDHVVRKVVVGGKQLSTDRAHVGQVRVSKQRPFTELLFPELLNGGHAGEGEFAQVLLASLPPAGRVLRVLRVYDLGRRGLRGGMRRVRHRPSPSRLYLQHSLCGIPAQRLWRWNINPTRGASRARHWRHRGAGR